MKKLLPWLAGLLVIFAIYLYASPYIALYNIKNAAEQKDADKLSGYIDFPSVKQGIKDQIKTFMVKEIASSEEESGFEALGAMLATAMVDPMVDSLVTPDGVAIMLQGEELDFDLDKERTKEEPEAKDANINYQTSYLSFNRFKVQINNEDEVDKSINVIMHRNWLSWKVTSINFSLDSKSTASEKVIEEPVSHDLDLSNIEDEVVTTEDDSDDVFHGLADDSDELPDTGNSKPSIWKYGFGMGYSEYSIQNGEGITLWVACNEGAGADYDHGVNLEIGDESYSNTDSDYPLTFIVDDRIEIAPPGTTTWRNGANAWAEFTDNISQARKIDVYLNDNKVTTFNPTVASIDETGKSIADCQAMLFNDTEW